MAEQNDPSINNLADILDGSRPAPQAQPPAPEAQAAPPTPPPVTPEPTTPTDTPPPAQPPLDFDAELVKITGGNVKSKEELAAWIDRSAKYDDLESRLKTFEDENTSLKAKVSTDPFANDFTKRLNDLYKSGATESQIQAFTAINRVTDLDGLSPVDARLLALQIKSGLTEEEARVYLNASYKIDPDENDEQTVKNENIRLKVDARADLEFLKTHKADVSKVPESPVDTQQKELEQKQTEQLAKLAPLAKTVTKDAVNLFKGMTINGKEGDQNIKTDFEPSEDSVKSLEPLVKQYIESNWQDLSPDDKGSAQIKAYVENILAIQNYKNWMIHAASVRETQVRAEYHNPTPINRGQDAPNPGKSSKEELDQKILASYY